MTTLEDSAEQTARRAEFDSAWRGFHRAQVRQFVQDAETELLAVVAERDAALARAERLAQRLETLHAQNHELRTTIDRISATPIEPDALQQRMRRMVELTREEAVEITALARETADDLRTGAERVLAGAEAERDKMRAEHRELVRRTQEQAAAKQRRADLLRERLDQESAHRRGEVETDFTQAMLVRRAEAVQVLEQEKAAASAKAGAVVQQAEERAGRVTAEADKRVADLNELRERLTTQLIDCRRLLSQTVPLLGPLPEESAVPEQRGQRPAEVSTG
ncbi:hypothetical protein [Amycolatopsis sp. H20-H5]|uniref:hypothetical protein n=1 Tax=Amycolatopsis sp. H20-H5 TaxID=3046309 RepID=UPI002DBA056C|nr:hypothetical protein [Amycolatopsis sp. H20-H5]MEC3981472.1 hypothetical protein [Amycolatopsis sp. H20-H5]